MEDSSRPRDTRPTAELFDAAQEASLMRDFDDGGESKKYWSAVYELHLRADDKVIIIAQKYLTSPSAIKRVLAVDVLAQVHAGNPELRKLAADMLLGAFQKETESQALAAMGVAMGHISDERAVPLFAPLANHPDEHVRFGVVRALTAHTSDQAISTLIHLTRDPAVSVRDWATFGLGSQCDVDTAELREALYQRLYELDDQTRGEALVGLARRKDERVVALIIERLEEDDIDYCLLEAAETFADPRFCQPLRQAIRDLDFADDPDEQVYWSSLILKAAAACCGEHGPEMHVR